MASLAAARADAWEKGLTDHTRDSARGGMRMAADEDEAVVMMGVVISRRLTVVGWGGGGLMMIGGSSRKRRIRCDTDLSALLHVRHTFFWMSLGPAIQEQKARTAYLNLAAVAITRLAGLGQKKENERWKQS
jgi:hypothetical protein